MADVVIALNGEENAASASVSVSTAEVTEKKEVWEGKWRRRRSQDVWLLLRMQQ